MRISKQEQIFIRNYWNEKFPDAKVYLFGSRADDKKRGGDIDLLVLSHEKINVTDKLAFVSQFMDAFGEQKLDLITFTYSEKLPFKNIALAHSVAL